MSPRVLDRHTVGHLSLVCEPRTKPAPSFRRGAESDRVGTGRPCGWLHCARGWGRRLGVTDARSVSERHPEAAGAWSESRPNASTAALKSSHIVDSAWGFSSLLWSLLFCWSVIPRIVLFWLVLSPHGRACILTSSVIASALTQAADLGLQTDYISSVSRLVSTVWGVGVSWPSPSSVGERSCYPGSDEGVEPARRFSTPALPRNRCDRCRRIAHANTPSRAPHRVRVGVRPTGAAVDVRGGAPNVHRPYSSLLSPTHPRLPLACPSTRPSRVLGSGCVCASGSRFVSA